jgi:phosphomannomutase
VFVLFFEMSKKTLALFDVDGTLTSARQKITSDMIEALKATQQKGIVLATVGGSDLVKQKEQLGEDILDSGLYEWVFTENGLLAHQNGTEIHRQNFKSLIGEKVYQEFAKTVLQMIGKLDIPVMTGTFIEYRNGMVNISPIGRNATKIERDEFEAYDKVHGIRTKMVNALREKYGEKLNLQFSVGGQISFDVFPKGWDKTYCLQFLDEYETIHFFGDKTYEGGNDYEIYNDKRTTGHVVNTYKDTIRLLEELF